MVRGAWRADREYAGHHQLVLPAVHELDAVAALYFGVIESLVRQLHGTARAAIRAGCHDGDADADGNSCGSS